MGRREGLTLLAAIVGPWVALLVACGAGGVFDAPPAAPAAAPASAPVAQAAPAPAAPAPAAPASILNAGPTWAQLWAEPWHAPSVGGWVNHSALTCAGSEADPDGLAGPAYVPPGATWLRLGNPAGLSFADGAARIDDTQGGAGWAILSAQTFDPGQALRLSAVIDLQPDPGAWLGLTLIQDESDYRELAIYEAAGALRVGLWAPCYWRDLGPVPTGARVVALEWRPGIGWAYSVDGAQVHTESAGHLGAALVGPPRVGLYVVNIGAESGRMSTGRIRARVGPVTVERGT